MLKDIFLLRREGFFGRWVHFCTMPLVIIVAQHTRCTAAINSELSEQVKDRFVIVGRAQWNASTPPTSTQSETTEREPSARNKFRLVRWKAPTPECLIWVDKLRLCLKLLTGVASHSNEMAKGKLNVLQTESDGNAAESISRLKTRKHLNQTN